MESVVNRLKTLLDERGTSVSEFARFLGMPQPTLNNYLKGERTPTIDSIVIVCNKCKVTSDWLLGLSENRQFISRMPSSSQCDKKTTKQVDALRESVREAISAAEHFAKLAKTLEGAL